MSIAQLLEHATPALGCELLAGCPIELRPLLGQRNGFFAFGGALLVRPAETVGPIAGVTAWNAPEGWRAAYAGHVDGALFFAEDAFGGPFALMDGAVHAFDPETVEFTCLADSLDDWATDILADADYLTGRRLLAEWEATHGPVPHGYRLMPKSPFVLGGAFAVSNLLAMNADQAMRARAAIALQLLDLPDGAQVQLEVTD